MSGSRIAHLPLFAAVFSAVLSLAPPRAAADPPPSAYHVVAHGRPVHAGDHVDIRVLPAPPVGVRAAVFVTTADGRTASLVGPYRAPYVIEPGASPIEVTAALSGDGWRREAKTTLELAPSRLIGVDDCLGPGQTFVREYGDIAGTAGDLSDMPQVLHPAVAHLPTGAGGRGFEGTIVVQVLVCRSGQVLDAYVPPAYRDPRGPAIERDPRVVDAAITAAQKYVFSRGGAAAWYAIPVTFGP